MHLLSLLGGIWAKENWNQCYTSCGDAAIDEAMLPVQTETAIYTFLCCKRQMSIMRWRRIGIR